MNIRWKKWIGPLCVVLVLVGCVVWIICQRTLSQPGKLAQVRVDGKSVMELRLDENSRREMVGANNIHLVVVVSEGAVYVESSECPDKICVHRGAIRDEGESIVCMPAKTVVEVLNA